jgi:hypothetical protein
MHGQEKKGMRRFGWNSERKMALGISERHRKLILK